MLENALELQNVSKKYAGFRLSKVSFELPMGSIMGFIGENGAGKTTTLKAILNLIRIDEGTITILGRDSRAQEREAKAEVGVVFDAGCFPTDFRPGEVGRVLRGIHRDWDDALYAEYLQKFELPAKKKVKELSRGMLMKLSIAAALAHRPRLLLLDEATSGLDPVMRAEILDVLLEFIQDEQHAVLLSSHITSDLEKIADYVTFIHKGQIVFSRQKDELLEGYGLLKCRREDFARLDQSFFEGHREHGFGVEALVKNRREFAPRHPGLTVDPVSIDDIMVFYGKVREEQ